MVLNLAIPRLDISTLYSAGNNLRLLGENTALNDLELLPTSIENKLLLSCIPNIVTRDDGSKDFVTGNMGFPTMLSQNDAYGLITNVTAGSKGKTPSISIIV